MTIAARSLEGQQQRQILWLACSKRRPRRIPQFLPRAGHAAVWDEDRGGMWLHGGYTTFFPYISSDGAGSDYGTTVSQPEPARPKDQFD